MINVQVKRSVKLTINKTILSCAAQTTLEHEYAPAGSDISLVIGDDALLKRLNLKYRSINATTDVLSFPSREPDPDTETLYLGDIVISLPRAQEQANSGGHSLADELQLLVVHGTLHLLGYDHMESADKTRMQTAQDDILRQLGVNLELVL
jgi:probable rRNA maturation factor